jgi:hypothetical protein
MVLGDQRRARRGGRHDVERCRRLARDLPEYRATRRHFAYKYAGGAETIYSLPVWRQEFLSLSYLRPFSIGIFGKLEEHAVIR